VQVFRVELCETKETSVPIRFRLANLICIEACLVILIFLDLCYIALMSNLSWQSADLWATHIKITVNSMSNLLNYFALFTVHM